MNEVSAANPRNLWIARIALIAAVLPLVVGLAYYIIAVYRAVTFPFELDYGEGIVWQQMRDIVAGHGYGQIARFPGLVFHYPPVYHLLTAGLSNLSGSDPLFTGRLLSAGSTLGAGAVIALIIARITQSDGGGRGSWFCGLIGGLSVLSMVPVLNWSLFMRVDMVGFLFSFAGLYFGLCALTRPKLVHLAALCFVVAVYTKQTNVAAPIAVFATLLFLRPRTALAGIATGAVAGFGALAFLVWQTNGGFLRHIVLYNINRIEVSRLLQIFPAFGQHGLYFGVAALGFLHRMRRRLPDYRDCKGFFAVRDQFAGNTSDAQYLMLVGYFIFASLVLLTIAKSGASYNYFIEWMYVLSVFVGLAMRDAGLLAFGGIKTAVPIKQAVLLPLAVAVQAYLLPDVPEGTWYMEPARIVELRRLSAMVRTADKPVISDDMVMLLRSGKSVLFEPAIFAELASDGVWDERPFIAKIRHRDFAFFITNKDRGDPLYDSRYNPKVAEAIAAAYPKIRIIADLTVHFPADKPQP
jgi:hypothetical protein